MKFQGTYLIIFAFAIAAYYIYLGIKILGKKISVERSSITDYITVLILVPLFINTLIVFIKDEFFVYKAAWIFVIIIFVVTAFYVTSVILGLSSEELDIYNASEEETGNVLEEVLKKMNISFSLKDGKYLLNADSETGKTAEAEINKYKIPQFVKLVVKNYKNINSYNEFFKEFKDTLLSKEKLEQADKKSYLFYFSGAAALIILGVTAIVINAGHLWI